MKPPAKAQLPKTLLEFNYTAARAIVFPLTRNDPEQAHRLFACYGQIWTALRQAMGAKAAHLVPTSGVSVSPAAGFSKNADFPAEFLAHIGFDRNVIGTVTGRSWQGNAKPRCRRFPETGSMINFLGLPNLGAQAIRQRLESQRFHLPTTLNISATPDPGYSAADRLADLLSAYEAFADFEPIDRIELNISCPNTGDEERARMLDEAESAIAELDKLKKKRKLYLKVSPDSDDKAAARLVDMFGKGVDGFVLCNTTTDRDAKFISQEWRDKGGVSGEGVYAKSKALRSKFLALGVPPSAIIACGGISSEERASEELQQGISSFQIYTPFVLQGPALIRKIKQL